MASHNQHKLPHTLCWDCALANGSGDCPWAENHTPVEGWNAIPNHVAGGAGYDSYAVIECPKFKRDSRNGGQDWRWLKPLTESELSSGDAIRLSCRIIDQAVQDWKSLKDYEEFPLRLDGQVVWRRDVVSFFNSVWFERLLTLASGDLDPEDCRATLKIPKE